MASVHLTFEQVVEAVRQLPEPQRKKLLQEIAPRPDPEEAVAVARRLRGKYRLGPKKRQRLSALLAKGNAGTLTRGEKEELNQLVEEFEQKTLELAQAVAETVNGSPSRRETS